MDCANRIEIESFITDINECLNKQYSEIECYRRLKTSGQNIQWNLQRYERYFIQLCENFRKLEADKGTNVSKKVSNIEEWIRYLEEVLWSSQEIKEKSRVIRKIRYSFEQLEWLQRKINFDDFEMLYLWKFKWVTSRIKRQFRQWKLTIIWLLLLPLFIIVELWKYLEPINWMFEIIKGK